MNEKEKQDLLRLAAETVKECSEITASVRQSVQDQLQRLAGDHLGDMMQSPTATARYLGNADAKLRQAALFVLQDHWGIAPSLGPALERMVSHDQDENVRAIALVNLVSLYRATNDVRIGRLAAAMVKDESLSNESRATAYYALFNLRGLSSEYWSPMCSPEWRFPDNVDWSFVDSFK